MCKREVESDGRKCSLLSSYRLVLLYGYVYRAQYITSTPNHVIHTQDKDIRLMYTFARSVYITHDRETNTVAGPIMHINSTVKIYGSCIQAQQKEWEIFFGIALDNLLGTGVRIDHSV